MTDKRHTFPKPHADGETMQCSACGYIFVVPRLTFEAIQRKAVCRGAAGRDPVRVVTDKYTERKAQPWFGRG